MLGFEYPTGPHLRRHGPEGYIDYDSYRDWLRDEFVFRCVYCLHREQWYSRAGTFNVEHFIPVSVDPKGRCEYTNLLYACLTCNIAKQDIMGVPDPCQVAFHKCLRAKSNGEFEALNKDGEKLRDVLRLNSDSNVMHRSRWMRNLVTLKTSNPELYKEYMGFPSDLPDLRPPKKRVPRNSKPSAVNDCYFAIHERGKLPATY
ncbi:MAG: HNH endonuclease [Pirellulales bacterium]